MQKRSISIWYIFLFSIILSACSVVNQARIISTPTTTTTPSTTTEPSNTPIPTATLTPEPTQVGGGTGEFIFELDKKEFSKTFPDLEGEWNVFTANLDGSNLTPVSYGLMGYNYLESFSPDGSKVLIASSSGDFITDDQSPILYIYDRNIKDSEPIDIGDGSQHGGGSTDISAWINNEKVVYIGVKEGSFGIFTFDIEKSETKNIYKFENDGDINKPFEIMAVADNRVYWTSEVKKTFNPGYTVKDYVWWSSIDGLEQGKLEFAGNQIFSQGSGLAFSHDGTQIAWGGEEQSETFSNNFLYIASISDINNPHKLGLNTTWIDVAWSPDGTKLLVFDAGSLIIPRDPESTEFGLYDISVSDDYPVETVQNMEILNTIMPIGFYTMDVFIDYSPDGRHMLIASSEAGNARVLHLETMEISEVLTGISLPKAINERTYWLP